MSKRPTTTQPQPQPQKQKKKITHTRKPLFYTHESSTRGCGRTLKFGLNLCVCVCVCTHAWNGLSRCGGFSIYLYQFHGFYFKIPVYMSIFINPQKTSDTLRCFSNLDESLAIVICKQGVYTFSPFFLLIFSTVKTMNISRIHPEHYPVLDDHW